MRKLLALLIVCVSLAAGEAQSSTQAPDISGTWQGTLQVTPQVAIRMQYRVTRAKGGGWDATMLVQNANAVPVDSVTVSGSTLEAIGNLGRYKGEISADGSSIHGTWIHGYPRAVDNSYPLELQRATAKTAWTLPPDPSPHRIQFITVDKDAKLEVLDWGGAGRPLVLLTGLGSDAHGFDAFAPKLTARYHVYGITRRGFGNSSTPLTGYSADRLGDDVLAVLDALHLDKPVLVGHSIAGEELSSIGSRFPQRVAGLVYLDAGYYYAYQGPVVRGMSVNVAMNEMQRKFDHLRATSVPAEVHAAIEEMLNTEIPFLTQTLQAYERNAQPAAAGAPPPAPIERPRSVSEDILAGMQRFTTVPVPILALFAAPHEIPPSTGNDPAAIAAAEAADEANTGVRAQADAFEKAMPSARVVRLPHASHQIYSSNEADVVREINAFVGGLPR